LVEKTSELVRKGSQLVTARYFTNREGSHPELQKELQVVQNATQLRAAIEASSRIPLLYGGPLEYEAERLIDGAFANNAPLDHALLGGATHLFVITGGRKPKVYDRPFQNYALRTTHGLLRVLENTAEVGSLETAQRAFQGLREVVPSAQPLDLEALEKKHGGKIQVIHPGASCPKFSRFFETRADVLGALYDHGRQQAESALAVLAA
jgi:predicted patatin/cPLA2 family phospholipase